MYVARVRVTGGFLSGLDVKLTPGLNVLIGGRGAGKTTLLELIRHGLGLSRIDPSSESDRVPALLGAGQVVLDVVDDLGRRERIIADADGAGRSRSFDDVATMVGQNELEAVASNAASRRSLVDLRAGVSSRRADSDVAALTHSAGIARGMIASLDSSLEQLPMLEAELARLRARENELQSNLSAGATATREQLAAADERIQDLRSRQRELTRVDETLEGLSSAMAEAAKHLVALMRDTQDTVDTQLSERIQTWATSVTATTQSLFAERERYGELISSTKREENAALLAAQPLRSSLEESERGLGEVTSEIQRLLTQLSTLRDLRDQRTEIEADLEELMLRRSEAARAEEERSEEIYNARTAVAKSVTTELDKFLLVTIEHLADTDDYTSRLIEQMKRSSLQYRTIIDRLAQNVLPATLLDIVEQGSVTALATELDITTDRAARVIEHLNTPDALASIAETRLDDKVDFWLVESGIKRNIEAVSTGQKCAITLPFLLTEHTRALILDQPEDNLDNAYLVSNIITAIRHRTDAGAQTIVATHNANIPVLGDAEYVISLESDGVRGSEAAKGPVDDDVIVDHITRLMEGGADAFNRRARFYRSHGVRVDT